MDLNTFTIDQLPFQTSEALPKDCTKYDVAMGAVPDEKDDTMPCSYMDEIFASGGDSPVPPTPVGPPANEIWYTGEYYDMQAAIDYVSNDDYGWDEPYIGPALLSNEFDGEKWILTFDGPVTNIGDITDEEGNMYSYPIFINEENGEHSIECNVISVTLPDSVKEINYGFYKCDNLTTVELGNSIVNIGSGAFYECPGLTSITIPNSVTSIGNYAFYGCTGLTSPVYNAHIFAYMPSSYSGEYTIPDGIEIISSTAFYSCSDLTSITIPNSVTSIGEGAFQNCSGLTSVTIGNGVIIIGNSAFRECIGLTSVTIGNSVTSIGDYAFSGCIGLTSVTIPNSVTSIGDFAFQTCTGLTSVTIGNSVASIGKSAFRGCDGLTFVAIPNSVTSIGENAFWYCSGLTSVTIGNSVTSIGDYAFQGCIGLESFTCTPINPPYIPLTPHLFNNTTRKFPIYVPAESVDKYKSKTYGGGWVTYADRIQAMQ